MKKSILKTLTVIATTGVLLTSLGANAADSHKCKAGEKYDVVTKTCMKTK